jgi:hypothetical protein
MVSLALWVILSATSGVLCERPPADAGWKEFRSPVFHFTVQYPSSWRTLLENPRGIDIVNFPAAQGQHGIVLSPTGASIQVSGPPRWIHTMDDWIRGDRQGARPIEDREIPIPNPPASGCAGFRRVVWRQDADGAGKHIFLFNVYYCSIGSKLFAIGLTNWEGDPKQAELREIAYKIAQSLRTR